MKYQSVILSALLALSVSAIATAGVAPKPTNAKSPSMTARHTPMTRQQMQALWRTAQIKLKADHLYSGPINGEKTGDSEDAVRTFQARHRLPQTGALDHATRQALGI